MDLYVLDVDNGSEFALFTTAVTESTPAWSPDGRWIAYELDLDGEEEFYAISAMPAPDPSGSLTEASPEQITDWGAVRWRPAWSPDSHWIAFTSDASGDEEIWITDMEGREFRQLTFDGGAANAAWSRP